MMANLRMNLRAWYGLVVVCCAGLLAYALYSQWQLFLDPCPLCVFQRIAFAWMGLVALVAAIHDPRNSLRGVYAALAVAGGVVGALVAGRHVWLQHLPPEQVPECGPGLNYMLDTMPLLKVLENVLRGDGSCAEVSWAFLGLSMPAWTLVWYLLLSAGTVYFLKRTRLIGSK